jgi:hypothetical protein
MRMRVMATWLAAPRKSDGVQLRLALFLVPCDRMFRAGRVWPLMFLIVQSPL